MRLRNPLRRRRRDPKFEASIVPLPDIARHLPDAPVVIEAGAHRGEDTARMAKHWPLGRIHAFEPVPDLHQQLARKTRKLKNVTIHQLAVSDAAGEATMHVSSGNDQSSSLFTPSAVADYPGMAFEEEITLETVTFDQWGQQNGIRRVDFFWLDLQGSELAALKGGERLLRSARAVYTEVVTAEQYEGEPLYPELRAWLEDHGFRVEVEKLPWDVGGNVLFVRDY